MLPAAVGSVVLAVNFPNNCDRSLLPDTAETDPASANSAPFIDRVRFTRTQFEAIWNGDASADQWTEVFPSLAADADCDGVHHARRALRRLGHDLRVQGLPRHDSTRRAAG